MNWRFYSGGLAAMLTITSATMAAGQEVRTAAAYINRDTGAVTENSNIGVWSSCRRPDRYDEVQLVSPAGTVTNNVHIDACLFDATGKRLNDGATYESYGVGYISACPDPDTDGPKTSTLSPGPTGNPNTRCIQTGFQSKGTPGDREFHARVNSFKQGQQFVVWCYDENLNGCADEKIQDAVVIYWRK